MPGPVSPIEKKSQRRLPEIEIAKGFAILLVVLGHMEPGDVPSSQTWYLQLHYIIYSFHMPLFMYLSGFVYFLTGQHAKYSMYGKLVSSRAYRLLLPFLIFGALTLLGKYGAHIVGHVPRLHQEVKDDLEAMLLHTNQSPVRSIWYVFVLFLFSIVTPLIWRASPRLHVLLTLAVIMLFIRVPDVMYLDRAFFYFYFFVMGGIVALNFSCMGRLLDRYRRLWLTLFGITLALSFVILDGSGHVQLVGKVLVGTASLFACHAAARKLVGTNVGRLLHWTGGYAFAIYLMNTIAIGLAALVLSRLASGLEALYPIKVAGLFAIGTFVPILVKRLILNRFKFTAQLTS